MRCLTIVQNSIQTLSLLPPLYGGWPLYQLLSETLPIINLFARDRQYQFFLCFLPLASYALTDGIPMIWAIDIMILEWEWRRACLLLWMSVQLFSEATLHPQTGVMYRGSAWELLDPGGGEETRKGCQRHDFIRFWLEVESTFFSILKLCFRNFYFPTKSFVERMNPENFQFWVTKSKSKCKSTIMCFSRWFSS